MPSAATASRLFVPPFPARRDRPRGTLSTILTLRRNPLEIWGKGAFEQPFWVGRSAFGPRAMAHDPAAVRHVLLDNAANYRKDQLQLRILSPGLGDGLLTADGEAWRIQRRALASLFSPREVAGFAGGMQKVAAEAVVRFERRPDGAVTDVGEQMARITLEVLEQTLFSQGLGKQTTDFARAVTRFIDTFGRIDPLDLFGAPDFLPRIGRLRGRATLKFFAEAVDAIIRRRRALIAEGAEPPRDVLTLLLAARDPETGRGLAEDNIRANIVTFINAGHETTANALTWTLYLLSQSPEWRERAEADADRSFDPERPASIEACSELRAVFEEAMRLYPPVALLSREAIADDMILGQRVPAGTIVLISPFVLHRHRGLWDNPDAFDPLRFLGDRRERIDRFAYIPFGAGPRVCIGMAFAMQEGIILLANLLRAFRFELVEGHVVMPQQRVTLRPRGGMKMHVKRREGMKKSTAKNFFVKVR
jgi:cytochrome P450